MATTVTMEVNNKIEIYTETRETAKSILQEINNNRISIAVPVLNGINYLLANGDIIDCNYNDGNGNIYGFGAKVVGRKIEKIPLIIMDVITELKKVQRRDFVRIPFLNQLRYLPIDKYNENVLHDLDHCSFLSGNSMDLSGGGMRIKISESMNLGQLMVVKTVIGNNAVLAICEVVRTEGVNIGKEREYIYGIKFKYIDSKVREDIIGFIFHNMRKAIKISK